METSLAPPAANSNMPSAIDDDSVPDPADRAAFERWLAGKDRMWSVVIASRAALRVLPLIVPGPKDSKSAPLFLMTFRCTAISRFASKNPNREIAFVPRADATAQATTHFSAAYAAQAAYAATFAATAAGAAYIASDAIYDAYAAAYSATITTANALFATVKRDADRLQGGVSPVDLARSPLWPPLHGQPDWVEAARSALKLDLAYDGAHWQVWIDWYEDVLAGKSRGEAWDEAFVDLDPDDPLPWDAGPQAVNEKIKARLKKLEPPEPSSEPLPRQSAGPHFGIGRDELIDLVAPTELDGAGNDIGRIRQLRPLVQQCAADLARHLVGKNVYPELAAAAARYSEAISAATEAEVPWGTVFGLGVMLANAADAAKRQIADRIFPELEDPAKTALDSLLTLHGPMILASQEGRDLAAAADAFQMTREQQAALEQAIRTVAERLSNSADVAKPAAANVVKQAAETVGKGPHPERGAVYGFATIRNVALVTVAAAVVSPPLLASLLGGGYAMTISGGVASLIMVEGLKKSATFISIATQIGARIDAMTGSELQAWIERRIQAAAPFRAFVLANEEPLRRIAETTQQLKWLPAYIDIIKQANSEGQQA
ncbi:MAG: hypothetical protein HC900_02780 [Methylacidiphilales bacterium]|nr:hypothetical protein [Candidatus Methylacidiphilales bacterium]